MTVEEVMKHFKKNYPGKLIVRLPENNPTEIICEVEPTKKHADYSIAIAAIKTSSPHFHKLATEKYEILSGRLKLTVDNQTLSLDKGETYTVLPNETHYATADFALVRVTSEPGWAAKDHILTS